MASTLTWRDHLRIEYTVARIDLMTSALPASRQRAIRRELRANLRAASEQVGSAEAVRRLGDLRGLARSYVDVEYGDNGPAPRWLAGLVWVIVAEVLFVVVAFAGMQGFIDGVVATDPHASGTYTWHALEPLVREDVDFTGGRFHGFVITFFIPAFGAAFVAMAAVVYAIGARAWRRLPALRR